MNLSTHHASGRVGHHLHADAQICRAGDGASARSLPVTHHLPHDSLRRRRSAVRRASRPERRRSTSRLTPAREVFLCYLPAHVPASFCRCLTPDGYRFIIAHYILKRGDFMSRNPNTDPPQPGTPDLPPTQPRDPVQPDPSRPEPLPIPPNTEPMPAPVREPNTPMPAGDQPPAEPTRLM